MTMRVDGGPRLTPQVQTNAGVTEAARPTPGQPVQQQTSPMPSTDQFGAAKNAGSEARGGTSMAVPDSLRRSSTREAAPSQGPDLPKFDDVIDKAKAQKSKVDPKVVDERVKEFEKRAKSDKTSAAAYLNALPKDELAAVVKRMSGQGQGPLGDVLKSLPQGVVDTLTKSVQDTGDAGAKACWNRELNKARGTPL